MQRSKQLTSEIDVYSTCSAGLTAGLADYCQSRNLDLKAHAERAGIDYQIIGKPSQHIQISKVNRLFESLSEETDDASVGLSFGLVYPLGQSSLVSTAMLNAPNVGAMLRYYSSVHDLFIEQTTNSLEIDGDLIVNTHLWSPLIGNIDFFQDFTAVLFLRHIQHHAGPNWYPERMVFQSHEPTRPHVWRDIFRCELQFGAPVSKNYYRRDVAKAKNPKANVKLFEFLKAATKEEYNAYIKNLDLISRVKRAISENLQTGAAEVEVVARSLGYSGRSLQRKLHERGAQFSDLAVEVRRAMIRVSLANDNLSIDEVASRCGYQSTSSFSRAVSRMEGMGPGTLRRELLA